MQLLQRGKRLFAIHLSGRTVPSVRAIAAAGTLLALIAQTESRAAIVLNARQGSASVIGFLSGAAAGQPPAEVNGYQVEDPAPAGLASFNLQAMPPAGTTTIQGASAVSNAQVNANIIHDSVADTLFVSSATSVTASVSADQTLRQNAADASGQTNFSLSFQIDRSYDYAITTTLSATVAQAQPDENPDAESLISLRRSGSSSGVFVRDQFFPTPFRRQSSVGPDVGAPTGVLDPGIYLLGCQALAGLNNFEGASADADYQFTLRLTPRTPKTFGVFVGSDDQFLVGSSLPEIAGKTDAQNVRAAFGAITSLARSSYLGYDAPSLTATPKADIFAELESYTNQVKPNDNFIFFYSGHGFGSRSGPASLDEALAITSEPTPGRISDDELTAWFSDPVRKAKWDGVNKLIILDSCFSGGFWQSEDADLSSIPKTALLAAAGEFATAPASNDLLTYGEGRFSLALQDALELTNGFAAADINQDGLGFGDLHTYLQNYLAYRNGYSGFIKDFPLDEFPQDPEFMAWDIQGFQSPDFEFSLAVPEPSLLAPVAMLWFAMGQVRMRARQRRDPE